MDGSNEKKREDEVLQKKGWKEYNADNQKVERENTNNKEYSHRITSGSHHRIIHYSDGSEDKRYSGNEENMRETRTKEIIYIRDNRKDSGVPVYPRRTEEERSYQEVDKSSHTRPVVKHSSSYHSGAFHQNGNVRSRHDSYSSSGQDNGSQQLNFSRYHKTGNPHPNTRSISSRQSLYSGNVVLSDNQTRNRQQDQQEKIKPVDYEEYWEKRYGKNKEGESFHFQNMDPDHSVVHIRNLEHLNDSRTEQRGHLYNRNQNAPIPIEMDERNDRRRLQTNTPGNQNNETIIQERIIIRELKENDDPEKFNILQHEISARDPSESQISARDPFESQISARDPSEPDGDQINTEARRGSLDDKNGGTTGRNATGQFQSSYQRPSEERFLDDQSHQQDGQTHTVYKTHVITKTYVTDRKSPENNSFSPKYQTGETHSNTKTSPEISSSHHTSFSVRHTEGLTEETKYSISPEDRTTRENISSDNPEKDANPTRSDDPESGVNSASSVKSNVQIIDKPLKVKKVPRYMEWYNKEKEDKPENNNSS
ncbi:uncharacterized protein LOC143229412 [Tachypleus tridentatus]|uniref:uncharacterized protein LOC143229412 n=1 Tax=Tachypleus tridentatus TaxID=6853 RepID=UPI003FD39F6E